MREGNVSIRLTTYTPAAMIAKARERLDWWLSKLSPPPPGQTQALRLVGIDANTLTYEVSLRPQVSTEARTIL